MQKNKNTMEISAYNKLQKPTWMQRSTIVCVSPSDFIFAELILRRKGILRHVTTERQTNVLTNVITHTYCLIVGIYSIEVVTDLSLSSAPPTITMLLSALSFSLKSSIPSMVHCSAFWPTTNNTGAFMSNSGSSTSCKPVSHSGSLLLLWKQLKYRKTPAKWCLSYYPSRPTDCKQGEAETDHSSQVLHEGHLK